MTDEVSVFRDTRAVLVESIWWDWRGDEVVWVDISTGLLHRGPLDGAADGRDDRVVELPPPVSAVQPAGEAGYVAALKDRVVLLDEDGRIERELAQLPARHHGIRLNEGKVDPAGRFVVGAMNLTGDDPDADLWSVTADRGARPLRGGFGVANGFEWSDDGGTMFVTDTATSTVYRAPYSADGELGEFEPLMVGRPSDGLAMAVDGTFFNGLYGEGAVVRWSAEGAVLSETAVEAPNVTSVAFVGPHLDTLLIGTARENLTESQLQRHPRSGAIFRIAPGVRGRPVHVFAAG